MCLDGQGGIAAACPPSELSAALTLSMQEYADEEIVLKESGSGSGSTGTGSTDKSSGSGSDSTGSGDEGKYLDKKNYNDSEKVLSTGSGQVPGSGTKSGAGTGSGSRSGSVSPTGRGSMSRHPYEVEHLTGQRTLGYHALVDQV